MTLLTLAEGTQMTSSAEIISGRCAVWALPHTALCARAARNRLREALAPLLSPSLLDDCATAVSELATNAFLHALGGRDLDGDDAPDFGRSELAIYRRGPENDAEIVITVFDPNPDLDAIARPVHSPYAELPNKQRHETLPDEHLAKLLPELPDEHIPESLPAEVSNGVHPERWSVQRGLDTVRELAVSAGGDCGFYRTRPRLGARPVSGKAAWFTVRAAPRSLAARPPGIVLGAAEAVAELRSLLAARGIDHMNHSGHSDWAVLSLPYSTVWSTGGIFTWRHIRRDRAADVVGDDVVRRPYADLIETVEQLVRAHEDRRFALRRALRQ